MKRIKSATAFLWLALLAALSARTLWNLAHAPSAKDAEGAGFSERLHGRLLESCAFHDEMIHLYGGWARASRRSVCNGVFRHPSGMLVNTYLAPVDATGRAHSLKALLDVLAPEGRSLLYVQLPRKIDRESEMLPRGFAQDFSHESIDGFLKALDSSGVPFLDVREMLDSTPEDVQRNFFKTDHHWSFDGAFKVFPKIAEALALSAGAESDDIATYVSPDAWERKRLPRRFLGYDGRRTGVLFAGTDEMFYYVPRFKTAISMTVPRQEVSREGVFEKSVMNFLHAAKPSSMLRDGGYLIYGNNFDHVTYVNALAPVKKRILVAKDSFSIPLVAWLATIFERVDALDFRHYDKMTLAEAARTFESDVVAVMHNPAPVMGRRDKLWNFCGQKRGMKQ